MLELINHARLTPTAEAQRFRDMADPAKTPPAALDWDVRDAYSYFGVDLNLMQAQYAVLPPVPPLAPNARLMTMARAHTEWMFANKLEQHAESAAETDAESILRRFQDVGYVVQNGGENIYAYARSVVHAHVGFEVDWGPGVGGMQTPPKHRVSNHNAVYREAGIGIRPGRTGWTFDDVGPYVGTVDLGLEHGSSVFVTGVAWSDRNGSGLYEPGEGIGGLRVDVSGAAHHAVTSPGGGYAVPVPAAGGTHTVAFSGLGAAHSRDVTVPAGQNVKVDLLVPASDAGVTVTRPGFTGTPLVASVAAPVGAAAVEWCVGTRATAPGFDANSATGVTHSIVPAGAYPLNISVNGRVAWHLAHPEPDTQWIRLTRTYLPAAGGTVTFQSRLGASNERQVARVQVSTDDGGTWADAWTKTGGTAAAAFAPVSVPLGAWAGRLVQLRFVYSMGGDDGWVNSTGNSSGWFIDDVAFSNVARFDRVASARVTPLGSAAEMEWLPTGPGAFVVTARGIVSGAGWSWAPVVDLTVTAPAGFIAWAQAAERTLALPAGAVANDPEADPTGAGIPALVRYALGIDPAARTSPHLPAPEATSGALVFTYARDLTRTDVTVSVEVSDDLVTWAPAGAGVTDVPLSTTGNVQTRRVTISRTATHAAARLKCVR